MKDFDLVKEFGYEATVGDYLKCRKNSLHDLKLSRLRASKQESKELLAFINKWVGIALKAFLWVFIRIVWAVVIILENAYDFITETIVKLSTIRSFFVR
ncbi:MAG: hypothetical protein EPO02_13510 [Nitrospirae bacterium]|nr:MAG: hypothetical protein EPO02_13510 [Nitrospirota bacterium]